MRITHGFLLMVLMSSFCVAAAQNHDDARRARRAVERGEYVELQGLIDDAQRRHPGRLISVDLDEGEYEIEILRDDGVVVEFEYDAQTGKLLDTEFDDD